MINNTTIRKWLHEANFNWATSTIIWQPTNDENAPSYGRPTSSQKIPSDHKILDKVFNSGYGQAECPRFIAEDFKCLYFPEQYDGRTSLTIIHKDISFYLNPENPTPYPGG